MRQIHWSDVTPQPFLRKPCSEMLTPQGFPVVQTAGARNSRVAPELREVVEVIHDSTYVTAFFNKSFSAIGLPAVSENELLECIKNGCNPLQSAASSDHTVNEYQAFYEAIHDELSTFAAMLPESGNGSRNPNDYTARWYHAVKLLEKLENLCQIEFKGKALTQEEAKKRLGRLK
ncbi:MAG: hypothetical protein ACK5RE_17980 [Pseudanabaena sp.]